MHLIVLCPVGGGAGVVPITGSTIPGRDHGYRLAHGRERLGRLYMSWLGLGLGLRVRVR